VENLPRIEGPILRVAIHTPVDRLFDYLSPADWADPRPGYRVAVPFGRTRRTGIVVTVAARSDIEPERLRQAELIADDMPLLDPPLLELMGWAADYYQHAAGEVMLSAIPVAARKGAALPGAEPRWHRASGTEEDSPPRRAPVQSKILALLSEHGTAGREQLSAAGPGWLRAVRALEDYGLVRQAATSPSVSREFRLREKPPELTPHQALAVDAFDGAHWSATLVDGITGSGKTEVYLRMIEQTLQNQKQSLVLVPEIGLTPQLVARIQDRFDVPVAVLHSGLTDTQRFAAWTEAHSARARIIVGTRSAIFAPLPEPGLIIVDEEHDTSYKQQEGFRYSARDLAVIRARRLDIPVVLGSATPSFESLENARAGRYTRTILPNRAGGASPPTVHVVDLRTAAQRDGLSAPLRSAMRKHLGEGGQVLLFLNRRGYAPTLLCPGCGCVAECRRCDARLVVHQGSARLTCHHCGSSQSLDTVCADCSEQMVPLGQGTERVEEALAAEFPEFTAARIDRDTTRSARRMADVLDDARTGKLRILLGTQMLTKGHDFHGVSLVGVIDADQGLFGTDFRSSERLAQTFVQVAGRAGRGQRKGEVYLQTLFPDHALLRRLLSDGYAAFAADALALRNESGWPPYSFLALLRAEANAQQGVFGFLELAKRLAAQTLPAGAELLGPAAAPMARRSGRYRGQLLVKADNRGKLHSVLSQLRHGLAQRPEARRVRWSLDVDPAELF
jgi:primosomal protein N' (replication factor Y)